MVRFSLLQPAEKSGARGFFCHLHCLLGTHDVMVLRLCAKLTCAGINCFDLRANTQHFPHSADNDITVLVPVRWHILIKLLFGSLSMLASVVRQKVHAHLMRFSALMMPAIRCGTLSGSCTGHIVDAAQRSQHFCAVPPLA